MKKIISTIIAVLFMTPLFAHAQQNTITVSIGPDLSRYQNCASFDACPGFRDALVEALTELLKQLLAEKIAEAQDNTFDSADYSNFQDATYQVLSSGKLAGESIGAVPDISTRLWNDFKKVVPEQDIKDYFSYMRVYFDDDDFAAAYVETDDNDSEKWGLGINLSDLNTSSPEQYRNVVETLVHEYAHVLTLNVNQVDGRVRESRCATYYSNGCAYANSYIHAYVDMFWDEDDFDTSEDIQDENDEDEKEEIADDYFEETGDYVTPYATWHPDEDIAESFAYFVLQDEPTNNNREVDEKLLFFYEYPELVTMRTNIRENFKELFNF